jgi:phosphohistidine phosphatase
MELFLIRHAKAADGALYGDDAERPLTSDGREAATAVGKALAKESVELDIIVTSPLVRAVETAELIAVGIGYRGALEVSSALEPGGRPDVMLAQVVKPRLDDGVKRLALVGHEPSMGYLLSALLQKRGLSMSKGAVVKLKLDGGSFDRPAKLAWIVKPKHLEPKQSLDAL